LGALLLTQPGSAFQGRVGLIIGASIGAGLGGAIGGMIFEQCEALKGSKGLPTSEPKQRQWLGPLLLLALANVSIGWLVFHGSPGDAP
jgi:hypothetical protein